MSDKQEFSQSENQVAPKRGFVGHLKRFWWAYAILAVILAVVVVVVAIFAVIPPVAQSKVNQAKLQIQGISMTQAEPDKFVLSINSTITTDGSIKANIDPFEGVMYLEDAPDHTPFLNVSFPPTNANKHQTVNITQNSAIQDPAAFDRFNVWFFNNETVRVTIKGKTKVQPKGLSRKYGVTFKKTVTLKGLNNFKGIEVLNGKISAPVHGEDFNATAIIPNPSVFTIDIGNATFNNYIENTQIGTLVINNLFLRPGNNSVPVVANLNQPTVVDFLQEASYCKSGIIPIKLAGTKVINHGQSLSYFVDALSTANQTVNLNVGEIVKNSLGFAVGCK